MFYHLPKKINQKGIAHILVLAIALGLIVFLLIANTTSFKNKLFSSLYLKSPSQAANTSANYIQNPSFETVGANPWYTPWVIRNDLAATFIQDSVDKQDGSYSMKVTVTTADAANPFHVQLSQPGIDLVNGQTTTTSFWAKASTARPFEVVLQQSASPFTAYDRQVINLTTSWQRFNISYSSNVSDPNVALRFNLAGVVSTVWLDNISVVSATNLYPIYWGALISNNTTRAPDDSTIQTSFETRAGKKISIVHWGGSWLDSLANNQAFFTANFDKARNNGNIPMVGWLPRQGGAGSLGLNPENFKLANITAGNYDSYITSWAQSAKAWGHPFFLRFAHEMNGWWYPWGEGQINVGGPIVNGNQAGDYVKAWQHVHNIFNTVGVTNATWVWCPNIIGSSQAAPLSQLYPGDGYVDWTCMDGYNNVTNPTISKSFTQLFKPTYDQIISIAPSKPMMIGETSTQNPSGIKPNWISSALVSELPNNFPNIKALVWFNWNDADCSKDWPIQGVFDQGCTGVVEETASEQAFASGIASSYYATNTFGNIPDFTKIQPITTTSGVAPSAYFKLIPSLTTVTSGTSFVLSVKLRSDIDSANLFSAKLKFDQTKLQVVSVDSTGSIIDSTSGGSWVEKGVVDNSLGTVAITAGVPTPGIKTNSDAQIINITFNTISSGSTSISLDPASLLSSAISPSAIYRNSDNVNILDAPLSTPATLTITASSPTPAPTSSPTPAVTPTPTPVVTPTPSVSTSPSSSPVPLVCSFNTATWSNTGTVAAGSVINFTVTGTSGCIGQVASVAVFNDNSPLPATSANNNPSNVTFTTLGTAPNQTAIATGSWIAEYACDGLLCLADPPEYYLVATSTTNPTTTITSDPSLELKVNRSNYIAGDGSRDGKVDLIDLSVLFSYWNQTTGNFPVEIDFNSDGIINTFDYSYMINTLKANGIVK